MPKSSTYHLLNVLRDRGFVTYYPDERAWGLGIRVFELGSAYLRTAPLQRLARPMVESLARDTRETSHLAVLHGTEVLYLDKQQPEGDALKLVTEVGVRLPAHLSAVGRAILAFLQPDQVRALYGRHPLVNRTGRGPKGLDDLLKELAAIRIAGFASEAGLITPGVSCMAAPVFSHEDVPMASLGITFLTASRRGSEARGLADALRTAAERLSRALGWGPQAAEAVA